MIVYPVVSPPKKSLNLLFLTYPVVFQKCTSNELDRLRYVRRWLAEERHGRLCNPESLREAAEAAGDAGVRS